MVEIWCLGFSPLQIVGGKFTCGKWLLESWLCLEFISAVLAPGHFLRIAVMNSPPGFLNWRCQRWHPTPVLLPGQSHGRRSLVGCSPWGREEADATEVTWQQQRQWAPAVELKLQEMSTRGQPFLTSAPGPSSKESLEKVGFLGCELVWDCAWPNT